MLNDEIKKIKKTLKTNSKATRVNLTNLGFMITLEEGKRNFFKRLELNNLISKDKIKKKTKVKSS